MTHTYVSLFNENNLLNSMRIKKLKEGFDKLTKEKARLIAHLIGDGAHYRTKHNYVMKYEVKDEESLQQFNDDIIKVYGLKPSWLLNTSGITGKPIKFIMLRSKLAFEDLLNYATYFSDNWKLKSPIINAPLKIKKEFLRALFDDEGSVRNKYTISLYSINKKGLIQIKEMLKEFEIKSKFEEGFGSKRNVYALSIKDFGLFRDKIGFNLTRKQQKLESMLKQ